MVAKSTHGRRQAARVACAAALATALLAVLPGCGSRPGGAPLPHRGRAAADRPPGLRAELRRMVSEGTAPGGAVLVRTEGHIRFGTAGVSDVRTGRAVRRADRFRAGSLTKTFIATVVLQLASERRLGLDDPVERYLPGLLRGPGYEHGRRVTIRQLLAHTSGLFDYPQDRELARQLFGAGFTEHRYDTRTPGELVRTALAHRPAFTPPGSHWHYSNTGYVVLGMVIERVTGRSYAAEVRRRILGPLALTGTSFPGTHASLPDPHGRGYSAVRASDGARRDVTELDPSTAGAAGELVSTLDDLTRFQAALLGGELLSPAGLAQMRDTRGTDDQYGLGIFPVRLPCGRVWGHNGIIAGSSALVVGDSSGRRVLAYHLNDDSGAPREAESALLRAVFCAPKRSVRRP